MLAIAAWSLVGLGIAHVLVGAIQFRAPLRAAISEGFVGRFMSDDRRRLAFWFIVVGPMLTLLGQLSLRAIATNDMTVIRTIGIYLVAASTLGVLAFPKSPLWLLLAPAALFVFA